MSIGIGAWARKVLEDDKTVIYEYGGYNLNEPEFRNEEHILDGVITISKECFAEPEIHEKLKRLPSGRKKKIIKRIPVHVEYDKMITGGLIVIENCSNCWYKSKNEYHVDVMACSLISKILMQYQENGEIPDAVALGK